MSVRRRRGNEWFFRTTVRKPDGRRERIFGVPKTFGLPNTKVGAQEAERRAVEAALGPPAPERKEIPTFRDFVEKQWWPVYPAAAGNRERTVSEKEVHLRIHLMPTLADVRLDKIEGEVVASLFAKLRAGETTPRQKKTLSPKSLKNIRTTLAKILASAHEWGVVGAKPRLPKVKTFDPEWDHLVPEESAAVVAAARTPEERALLLFALHTGARAGEQRVIEWGDVDWHNRQVAIRKSLASGNTKVGPPKGGKERRVPLSTTLGEALKAIRGLQHLQGGLIFTRPETGGPLSMDQLRERLWSACRRAGVREVRWHDLRHTFASQLIAAGVDLLKVKTWLGHKDIVTTMRYAHLAPGAGDAIAALDRGTPVAPRAESLAK